MYSSLIYYIVTTVSPVLFSHSFPTTSLPPNHFSSLSLQKQAGLLWTTSKHDIGDAGLGFGIWVILFVGWLVGLW